MNSKYSTEGDLLCNSKITDETYRTSERCKNLTYNYGDSASWQNIYDITVPVNIIREQCLNKNIEFEVNYIKTKYKTIINDNSKYIIPMNSGCYVKYENIKYEFIQSHIHEHSENSIDGEYFPIEMHFVHKSINNELLVLALLFDIDDDSIFPKILFDSEDGEIMILDLSFLNILEELPCYIFKGTLTTPPFTDNVRWIVYSPIENNGLTITNEMYEATIKYCKNNHITNFKSDLTIYYRN